MRLVLGALFVLGFFAHSALAEELVLSSTPVDLATCEARLIAPVQKQMTRLNPALDSDASSLSDLYLRLKQAEFEYAVGVELPAELAARLREEYVQQYRMAELSGADLRQFYVNALRSLYVRVAAAWKTSEAERLMGVGSDVGTDVTQDRAAQRFISDSGALVVDRMIPRPLELRELTPERAAEFFAAQSWESFPWPAFAKLMKRWHIESNGQFSQRDFSKFWDVHAAELELSLDDYQTISSALNGGLRAVVCCMSEPGCVNCPNNRRWRNQK